MKRTRIQHILSLLIIASGFFTFSSCQTVDVFEKNVTIPQQAWSSQFKPEISFEITDTVSRYNIFVVLRHSNAYRYKNLYLSIDATAPDGVSKQQMLDMELATDDKGWLGKGMDDIYEQRVLITPADKPWELKKGIYRFRLANTMREDPLEHVMNVGIRVEKAK